MPETPAEEAARPTEDSTEARPAPTRRHHAVARRIGMTPEQFVIAAGIMSALAVAALDSTVVSTAMPTIIGDLRGLSEYGWVFSAYLLASTVTVPLYARMADMYGRKPIFLTGIALFVAGSMLCGFANSMTLLILFRAIQGLGAGAVQPIAFTIAGDIFESEQRAKIQGLFSGVWGAAAVVGPAIGSIITTTVGWRWVFFVNAPVGLLAGVLIGRFLHERVEHHRHRLDLVGAGILTLGLVSLLFAAIEGGQLWGWTSPVTLGLVAAALALLAAFVVFERRVAEPLIDLGLLRIPVIAAGLAIGGLSGVVMFSLSTYVPPLVQGVMGGTALEAGVAVAAMSIGWPIGSIVGGRALLRFGARPTVLAGMALLVVGTAVVTQAIRPGTLEGGLVVAALGEAVTGLGMGLSSTTILVMVQAAVPWQRRAVATGLVQFSRTIGGAVGVGLLGGLVTAAAGNASGIVLDPIGRNLIPAAQLAAMRSSLSGGLEWVFIIVALDAAVVAAVALRFMPTVHVERRPSGASGTAASGAASSGGGEATPVESGATTSAAG
ncbi:MAG: MDR family MFS transporter [Candidatus Limnocylindrales bacterium]|jgi:EmrB/QacA subfamily drug resistance transporter